MSKHLGVVAFAALCFFALYVLIAPRPTERVNRLCTPAGWTIKTFSAVGSLFSERGEHLGRAAGEDIHRSCRYLAFRVLYEDLYLELQRQQLPQQVAGTVDSGATNPDVAASAAKDGEQ